MRCLCGADTGVKDSRVKKGYVWRRRKCQGCGEVFTTYETIRGDSTKEDVIREDIINSITNVELFELIKRRLHVKEDGSDNRTGD